MINYHVRLERDAELFCYCGKSRKESRAEHSGCFQDICPQKTPFRRRIIPVGAIHLTHLGHLCLSFNFVNFATDVALSLALMGRKSTQCFPRPVEGAEEDASQVPERLQHD